MAHKRGATPYAKRRNKRRATLLQARKVLPPEEFELLRRAVERHQNRDHIKTYGGEDVVSPPLL